MDASLKISDLMPEVLGLRARSSLPDAIGRLRLAEEKRKGARRLPLPKGTGYPQTSKNATRYAVFASSPH